MPLAPALAAAVPEVAEALNNLLDTGDDELGAFVLHLTAKQMVVLAARTANSVEDAVGYKAQTDLISGEGASYKVYFGLVAV